MLPIRTILHPTDFSDNARHAFRLACSLAKDYGARLIVLHVVVPPLAVYEGGAIALQPELDQLEQALKQLLPEDPAVRVEHRLQEGDAVGQILAAAEETACDLVVMSTHGRSGIGRLLMGSVADLVVRKAPCPVLTLRTPFQPAEGAGHPNP